jgi:hypothetical protein
MPNQTICSIGHAQACVTKRVQPASFLERDSAMSALKQKPAQNSSVFDGFQTLFKPSASLFKPIETSQMSIAAAFLDHTKQWLNNSIKKMP